MGINNMHQQNRCKNPSKSTPKMNWRQLVSVFLRERNWAVWGGGGGGGDFLEENNAFMTCSIFRSPKWSVCLHYCWSVSCRGIAFWRRRLHSWYDCWSLQGQPAVAELHSSHTSHQRDPREGKSSRCASV